MFAFCPTSFCKTELYVAARSVRGPQRHLAREKEEITPRSSAQEEKQPHGAACGLPTPHCTLISSLPGGGWPLLCPPSPKPGWGESRNPEEVQQFQDAITQEGQASFESLIFKSEHLENSTAPPFLTAHHPLKKESFLSSYTDTEQPVSPSDLSILIRAYSVPTSNSLRKQRETKKNRGHLLIDISICITG